MTAGPRRALAMFTAFFASDDIEATARRPGFGTRASQMTGTLLLALVPLGAWSDAHTTWAPLAAQVTQVVAHGAGSPAARPQRLHQRALVCRQALLRQGLATVPALAKGCAAGLLTACPQGDRAASPGFGLPARGAALCPGSGGRAPQAGAKRHAVWDSPSRVLGQGALTPWHLPEQPEVDPVVALAQPGLWCIFA